jgi:putative copper resistance protein D
MNALLILSRALHFGACLVLLSIFAVRLLVERPRADESGSPRKLAALCLALAACSGFLWFWAAAAGMNGSSLKASLNASLFQMILEQTPPGHIWLIRCAIGLLLGIVLCLPRGQWRWHLCAALAAAFTASLAWLGHAGAGEDGQRTLMLTADVFHLLSASLWPAGLLPFALLLRRLTKAAALPAAHAASRRFSSISLVTVALLAASGSVNAFFLVGSFHALASTDYGRLLILKLALFAAAATLGARNLIAHKPALENTPAALRSIARNVWIEAALGAFIILIVAILGTLPPASSIGG